MMMSWQMNGFWLLQSTEFKEGTREGGFKTWQQKFGQKKKHLNKFNSLSVMSDQCVSSFRKAFKERTTHPSLATPKKGARHFGCIPVERKRK